VRDRLENPLTSPTDKSPERIQTPVSPVIPSKPLDQRQEDLVRRCLALMLPPPPMTARMSVPEIEVRTIRSSSSSRSVDH
jgi:hypothetical protein